MKRLTTEDYIEKATEVHGNRYDYSDTVYKTSREKITIKCYTHGKWECNPRDHLNGNGCPTCWKTNRSDIRTKSTEQFITEANIVHNNKYKYPNTIYKRTNIKVKIECPIHGEFEQSPNMHLSHKNGCPECKRDTLKANGGTGWSRSDFIERCKNKLATFYIIQCTGNNETFYKLGITANTVKRRYDSKVNMPYKYKIIYEIKADAETIFNLELKYKQLINNHKYKPQIKFNGSTYECFTDISLIEI